MFLIIYEDSSREVGEINARPGICYVLTPNKDDMEERKLELYKYFKGHIISAYIKLLMRKHDEEEAKKWKDELVRISDELLIFEKAKQQNDTL